MRGKGARWIVVWSIFPWSYAEAERFPVFRWEREHAGSQGGTTFVHDEALGMWAIATYLVESDSVSEGFSSGGTICGGAIPPIPHLEHGLSDSEE